MKNDNTPAAAPTVHRFVATPTGQFKVQLPNGAQILDVVPSSKGIAIYALVDPTAKKAWRYFVIVGTGAPLPHGWEMNHLKSVQIGGPAIHLFDVPTAVASKMGYKTFAKSAVKPA